MVGVYIICTIVFIPGTLLTIGIGVVLQLSYQNRLGMDSVLYIVLAAISIGVLTVYVSAVLGSTTAMLLEDLCLEKLL